MGRRTGLNRYCPVCKKSFYKPYCLLWVKACSISCAAVLRRGKPSKSKGKNYGHTPWNKGKKGLQIGANRGVKFPYKARLSTRGRTAWNRGKSNYWCIGEKNINWKRDMSGDKNPCWLGGISFNPYPKEFNQKLKLRIRARDGFVCCLCKKTEKEELEEFNRVLCVNHIDFNKLNCKDSNLNTLCLRCNIKINRQRTYWTNYFNSKQVSNIDI